MLAFSTRTENKAIDLDQIPFMSRIGNEDLSDLQAFLNKYPCADPYQRSAGYYAITGRKGLWKVEKDNSAVLCCLHPNIEDTLLVFPPLGENGYILLVAVFKLFSQSGLILQLARVTDDMASMILNIDAHISDLFFKPMPEKVLDWTYPVHVLHTERVSECSGGGFQHFRQKLNHLDLARVYGLFINTREDKQTVTQILRDWARNDGEKMGAYYKLLEIFDHLPLIGRIIFYGGLPVGFSMWEETDSKNALANAYAHLALHDHSGLSQYVMLDMCRSLKERGFEKVCIGGSETEGLDRFKRKMCPVESVPLYSYAVKSDTASNQSQEKLFAQRQGT